MNQLTKNYEKLCFQNEDGDTFYKVDFFPWSKTFCELFELPAGTQGILKIISFYKKYMDYYNKYGVRHPVIIIVDDDKGSKCIFNRINSKDKTKSFHAYSHNLYVVSTPLVNGAEETKIEDYFDEETLNSLLQGKKFSADNHGNGKNDTYGKTAFAENVIRPKQSNINFNNFKPLLDRIVETIDSFYGESLPAKLKDKDLPQIISPSVVSV